MFRAYLCCITISLTTHEQQAKCKDCSLACKSCCLSEHEGGPRGNGEKWFLAARCLGQGFPQGKGSHEEVREAHEILHPHVHFLVQQAPCGNCCCKKDVPTGIFYVQAPCCWLCCMWIPSSLNRKYGLTRLLSRTSTCLFFGLLAKFPGSEVSGSLLKGWL